MNWLILLSLAVIIAAVAAVTGIKPKETRPVAHSRMMGMARFVLVVLAVILAYAAFRARAG
jgi:putative Mn2+ efflux pump MntP